LGAVYFDSEKHRREFVYRTVAIGKSIVKAIAGAATEIFGADGE
jgi:hypothetical protein